MHYLITGHTGFKGSWLAMLLRAQGHNVSGISLPALPRSLYSEAELSDLFDNEAFIDIRDTEALKSEVNNFSGEVVIHLAAQALVRESYRDPIGTFATNVMGTLNLLEALKGHKTIKSGLVITTDKVYKNINKLAGYVESEPLGGEDPYSASKAAADIVVQSWIKNFAQIPLTIARAGNVVGTADWAADRLLPDLITAYSKGEAPVLRYPYAIRPWQHVLDCLNGYLTLIDSQLKRGTTGEWNFGPEIDTTHTVALVSEKVQNIFGSDKRWQHDQVPSPHESGYLLLDSSKARTQLNWRDRLDFTQTIAWTVDGYRRIQNGERPRSVVAEQISNYLAL